MNLNDRVRIKHVGIRYFLCLDPRGDDTGLFVDDWGTVEPYPMRYVEAAPKTVEEIAWDVVAGYYADDDDLLDGVMADNSAYLHALILAAIEEAQSCEK